MTAILLFVCFLQLQVTQGAAQIHPNQQYTFAQTQRPQTLSIVRTQITTRPNLVSTPSTPTTMTLPSSLSGMVTQQQQTFNQGTVSIDSNLACN